jgi:uncharacterized alkaline shock family protein YloU
MEPAMSKENNALGRIEISPQAVASVASQAVLSSYGIVGMAAKNVVDGIANAITRDPRKGIEIHFAEDKVNVDLYVVVEYGMRITAVSNSVANAVRFNIEKDLGLPVGQVNVHVQGLRVSNTD